MPKKSNETRGIRKFQLALEDSKKKFRRIISRSFEKRKCVMGTSRNATPVKPELLSKVGMVSPSREES
jgi:hypothetical protein